MADSAWQIVMTHGMPRPGGNPEAAVKATRDYLASHPDGVHAVEAAFWIGAAWQHVGRSDQAVAGYEEFLDGKGYRLPEGDAASQRIPGKEVSPAEFKQELVRTATFRIAQIRFGQKRYTNAIEQWTRYVSRFPNGSQWAASQEANTLM